MTHTEMPRIETETATAGNVPTTATHSTSSTPSSSNGSTYSSSTPTSTSTHTGDEHVFSLVRRGICKNTKFTISPACGLRERVVQRRFWDTVREEATKDGPDALLSYLKEHIHQLPHPKQAAASPESQRPVFQRRQLSSSKLNQVAAAPAKELTILAPCKDLIIQTSSSCRDSVPKFSATRNRCGSAVATVRILSADQHEDLMETSHGKRRRQHTAPRHHNRSRVLAPVFCA